eukprot:NODE_109_length_2508_cov_17.537617_g99_i0.p1 GENE.NODE_109_length_2508_cov_17.537617_g99_i0~~NODE_109_length_2508_cov_17.537617_g99_i0.p1  ORF type:complete len:521 (-),score=133.30 NODE_109_length_2508_cov_17.537617_g99_i0:39-1601(-)
MPQSRRTSPLSRYLYNPETTSSLSKDHYTDNPNVIGTLALPFFKCPQFNNSPGRGMGTEQFASQTKPASPMDIDEVNELKIQLVEDLCHVLATLQYDPFHKVSAAAHQLVNWLQSFSSTKSMSPLEPLHSEICNQNYLRMELPCLAQEARTHGDRYATQFEALSTLFRDYATRTYTPSSVSLEPIGCCGTSTARPFDIVVASCFRMFEPTVVMADNLGTIHISSYGSNTAVTPSPENDVFGSQLHRIQEAATVSTFVHTNRLVPKDARNQITSLHVLNDHADARLLVTDCYGQVSVYGSLAGDCTPVTAFRISDFQDGRPHRVVTDWHQKKGLLYLGGMHGKLHVFDLEGQRMRQTVAVPNAPPTVLHCDPLGTLLIAGFRDGSLRVWDQRQGSHQNHQLLVGVLQEPQGSEKRIDVVNCLYKGNTICSGYGNGAVKIWDVRKKMVSRQLEIGSPIISFDVHRQLPLYACVMEGKSSYLRLYNLKGELLATRQCMPNLPSRAIFHPLKGYLTLDKEVLQL